MRRIATVAALAVSLASMAPVAFAQSVPAPKWCVDMLNAKPEPTPIVDLYERVRTAIRPKGEFETTAAFDQRVENGLPELRASLVSVYGSSRTVFYAPLPVSYEPDKGFFDVGLNSSLWPITGWNEFRTSSLAPVTHEVVAIERQTNSTSEYVGQNAYGASRTITKVLGEEYGVALTNLKIKSGSWLRGHFIIRMPPERAAEINGKLSVLIVGELTSPGVLDGVWRFRPTIQRPMDETINQHYVAITAVCGGVVARGSRELLRRLN